MRIIIPFICLPALVSALIQHAAAQVLPIEPDLPSVVIGEPLTEDMKSPGIIETAQQAAARFAAEPRLPDRKRSRQAGEWATPSRNSTYTPHSGAHYIANKHGDLEMSLRFVKPTTVHSVWLFGQGSKGAWPTQVRAIGFRGDDRVATTAWQKDITDRPRAWQINLTDIDRLVIEALPGAHDAAWYGLDDLTITPTGGTQTTLTFDNLGYRHSLTNTGHGGIVWEKGGNRFADVDDQGVPAPRIPEDFADDKAAGDIAAPLPLGGTLPATSPVLLDAYQGTIRGDAGSFSFPPDTHMAAGPDHVVILTNRQFVVLNKTTGQQQVVTGLGFLLPSTSGDPRVMYDQYTDRWVAMATDFNSQLQLSVSLTDDPTGAWFKTEFTVSAGADAARWPDHPTMGIDEHGIYMAAFMVGGGMSIFAVDKAPLIAPTPSLGTVTAFRGLPFEGAIHPVHTYGFAQGQYFISRTSASTCRLRRLDGPLTNPALTDLGTISIPVHGAAPDAPAQGSAELDTVDTRLWNAVYRDGSIWTTHHVDVDNRSAVRWYEFDAVTQTMLQSGTVSDEDLSYMFPSLAVDESGNMVLGFSGSSPTTFASAYFCGRAVTDPANITSPATLYHAGTAPQSNFDNFGRNRWGDYSQTAIDPDGITFWTAQTYGHATNIWGTFVAKLGVQIPPPGNVCLFAPQIDEGATAFTTVNSTTDGTDTACGQIEDDVWFRFVPLCEGDFEISVTDTDFDGTIALYGFACPSETIDPPPLACADSNSPEGLTIRMPLDPGLYRIRIGSTSGVEGSGVVNLTCFATAPPCPWDCTPPGGNGVVNIDDVFAVVDAFTTQDAACDISPDNGDGTFGNGVINVDDLLEVINRFGPCPTP